MCFYYTVLPLICQAAAFILREKKTEQKSSALNSLDFLQKLLILCKVETFVESINTSAGINELLLSGEERMAV